MFSRMEQMLIVIEEAAVNREIRLTDPQAEPDETTESDVTEAMLRHNMTNKEILRYRDPWTKALRIMLRPGVDQQG